MSTRSLPRRATARPVLGAAAAWLLAAPILACGFGGEDEEVLPIYEGATYARLIAHPGGAAPDALDFVDAETLVTATDASTFGQGSQAFVRFHRVADGAEARPPIAVDGSFFSLDVSPDGAWLAVGVIGGSSRVLLYALADPAAPPVDLGGCGTCTVRFGHGSSLLAVGATSPHRLVVHALPDAAVAHDLTSAAGFAPEPVLLTHWQILSLAFVPGDASLVVARGDGRAAVVRVADGGIERVLDGRAHSEHQTVAISADGARVALTATDRGLHVWDLADGRRRVALEPQLDADDWLRADVRFAPGGARIFHIERSSIVVARDAASGALIGALGAVPDPGPERGYVADPRLAHDLTGLAVSPDGRWLAAIDATRGVRLWRLR